MRKMRGRTHLVGGITVGLMLITQTELPVLDKVTVMALSSFTSLLPDIDTDTSTISNMLKPLRRLHGLITSPFKFGSHRGITHSLLYALLLALPFIKIPIFALAVFLGISSHILLDMISGGVCLFSPLSNKRIRLGSIKTNSFMEWICFGVIMTIAGLTVVRGGIL